MVSREQHDLLMSIPDLMSRMRSLEQRSIPSMLVRITDLEDTCLEMRRRAGDAKAFSLKAQRAFAEDTTKGNAHFDFDALDEKRNLWPAYLSRRSFLLATSKQR